MNFKEELNAKMQKRLDMEAEIHDSIFKICEAQIRSENDNGNVETIFSIPAIMLGHPLVDREDCRKYIMYKLRKDKIKCRSIKGTMKIYIKWGNKMLADFDEVSRKTNLKRKTEFDENDIKMFNMKQ